MRLEIPKDSWRLNLIAHDSKCCSEVLILNLGSKKPVMSLCSANCTHQGAKDVDPEAILRGTPQEQQPSQKVEGIGRSQAGPTHRRVHKIIPPRSTDMSQKQTAQTADDKVLVLSYHAMRIYPSIPSSLFWTGMV